MNNVAKQILYWSPRVITILFALFMSVFAADVFDEQSGLWNTLIALFIHLIPTFIILALLIISWNREWIGALMFCAIGVFYITWTWGRFPLITYVIMTGPLFLIGILFLLNWLVKPRLKTNE